MIIVRLSGGLGNQMFQYALGKTLAKKHKTRLKLDITDLRHEIKRFSYIFRKFDLPIFNLGFRTNLLSKTPLFLGNIAFLAQTSLNQFHQKFFPRTFIREKGTCFDPTVLEAPANAYLWGFWQSPKYFEGIKEAIRQDFTSFKHPLSDHSKKLLAEISGGNSISVNFRRTDYVTEKIAADFHGVPGHEYYDEAVRLIKEKVANPKLYIFSDDIEWCKKNVKYDLPTTFVGHQYAGPRFSDYLQLMIACKHHIIPNSTFAWWAAWLCQNQNKIVIAPAKWFVDPANKIDIYPNSWIKL